MSNRVWVVDDDRSIRWVLERAMSQAGIPITAFASADHAMHHLDDERPIAVITDVRMPGMDGMDFIDRIHDAYPELPVIVMTAHSDLDSAINAYQSGAFEYLPKPFDVDEAIAIVRRAITFAEEAKTPARIPEPEPAQDIIGQAPAMQEVFRAIGRLANSNVTVLIRGASGSGKELVARALHRHSPRANGNFVALNMAAIPRELVESELFGHEKGAFTGANNQRVGRFEQANGGTLFLDEIGDMPPDTQTRLLRVLSNGEFYRVGGHQPIKVNVRIIAATHQDLEERVQDGTFREDLFHRLNVISVHVPTLAERKSDIPLLARHFLDKAAEELGGEPKLIRPEAMEYMTTLAWPGNVRQLENTCRWLTVMASGREIHIDDLPPELRADGTGESAGVGGNWEDALEHWADDMLANPGREPLLDVAVPRFERIMIRTALKHTGGRKRDAAELLGWGRNTLTRKIAELDMTDL
ncbi:MAG: nitrogen regulation protein NR(I) [Gammaproteobacteria bacterium]|nr:nitrogen regulation protein NR(I) [Gammaproteobacteria bacterium]MBK82073.1 nitrogen regulation protein NR(I) [Gammaproteobacteria bacterium]